MLPFLKPKKLGSTVMVSYKEGKNEVKGEEGEPDMGLIAAAEDLLSAIAMKDAAGVVSAMQALLSMSEDKSEVNE